MATAISKELLVLWETFKALQQFCFDAQQLRRMISGSVRARRATLVCSGLRIKDEANKAKEAEDDRV